jgi:hypothetical protein
MAVSDATQNVLGKLAESLQRSENEQWQAIKRDAEAWALERMQVKTEERERAELMRAQAIAEVKLESLRAEIEREARKERLGRAEIARRVDPFVSERFRSSLVGTVTETELEEAARRILADMALSAGQELMPLTSELIERIDPPAAPERDRPILLEGEP